jgi:hypothetical protein
VVHQELRAAPKKPEEIEPLARCIASVALRRPFPLYFLYILYTNTANNKDKEGEEIRAHHFLRGSNWLDQNINSISGGHANVHHECASAGSTLWLILSFCSGCDSGASRAGAGSVFELCNCTNGSHKNM